MVMVRTYITQSIEIWTKLFWDPFGGFFYFLAGSPQLRYQSLPTARDLIPFVHACLSPPITWDLDYAGGNLRNFCLGGPDSTHKGQGYPQ